jgi:hypothetical protein
MIEVIIWGWGVCTVVVFAYILLAKPAHDPNDP